MLCLATAIHNLKYYTHICSIWDQACTDIYV